MTTTEVARALGISYRRVHAWAARGYIDGLACNGRGPRFSGSPTTSPALSPIRSSRAPTGCGSRGSTATPGGCGGERQTLEHGAPPCVEVEDGIAGRPPRSDHGEEITTDAEAPEGVDRRRGGEPAGLGVRLSRDPELPA
jgi:hypothetical protein